MQQKWTLSIYPKGDRVNNNIFRRPVATTTKFDEFVTWIPSVWEVNDKEEEMADKIGPTKKTKQKSLTSIFVMAQLRSLTNKRKMFSAWDITQKLNANITKEDFKIPHGDVLKVVTDWFVTAKEGDPAGDYCRTLIRLKNGKITWVYHPDTVSVDKYPGYVSCVGIQLQRDNKDFSKYTYPQEEIDKYKDLDSDCGCGCGDSCECGDCNCEDIDFEDLYNRAFKAGDELFGAVEEFLAGEKTLAELEAAQQKFSTIYCDLEEEAGVC